MTTLSQEKFVILVPAFHMEKYIERALRSAFDQEYRNFRVIFIEDHGADGTWANALSTIAKYAGTISVSVHSNRERQGILGNHVTMLNQCEDDEIAVCLDGDDQLANPQVLFRLAEVYSDPNVWLTYGSYEYDHESRGPDPGGTAAPIPPDAHTRLSPFFATHLKTFRVKLFRHVKDEDLRFHGEYFDPVGDVALMAPMIEMAGPQHARFMYEILYLYNGSNPMNDVKIKPRWIKVMSDEIKRRPIYPLLESL